MSFVGWLDYSEAEQQRVRDMLKMFAGKGTVDDLGVGTVRDAISNRLFPGTSIVQTRARYFLFIPWIFRRAEQRHPGQLVARAEVMERRLIGALREATDQDGLIGRQAGKDVRILPSSIYWTGLAKYGIFLRPGLTKAQYGRAAAWGTRSAEPEDELAERSAAWWHRSLPPAPEHFFDFESADFDLTHEEALWLSERVLSAEAERGPNLLGDYVRHLRAQGSVPREVFWEESLPPGVAAGTCELVRHAQCFSAAVHGASLLYNLMLHEQRDGDERGDAQVAASLRHDVAEWADGARRIGLPAWCADLGPFWQSVTARARIPPSTKAFVDGWSRILAGRPLDALAEDPDARALIRQREVSHKRAQARFQNRARLRSWAGDAGLVPLEFRWSQVRRFLDDLSAGLQRIEQFTVVAHAAH